MSIQTPGGIYSPTRVLQGCTDSGKHFQAVTRDELENKVPNLIQWIDDFLLHAKSEDQLLYSIEKFLNACDMNAFKVHALKSHFFLASVAFFGKIISNICITFNPQNIEAILNMKIPQKADELQQLVCAANWMR